MTNRASLQLTTSKRGPPRRRHVPDAPVGGWQITTAAQPVRSDFSLQDHPREIAIAIAEIEKVDQQMLQLEADITQHRQRLDDPAMDGWDRLDAVTALDDLLERHSALRQAVVQHAVEIGTHGAYMVDDWADLDLADIGRAMSPDVRDRVLTECPGIGTTAGWQVLSREVVPF